MAPTLDMIASTPRVALLARPSVLERARELHDALCLATPSYAPGVAAAMAELATLERSVSAAGLLLGDGSRFGSFNGDEGTFADARRLAADIYGADEARLLVGGSTEGNHLVAKLLSARSATVAVAMNAHHSAVLAYVDDQVDFVRAPIPYDPRFEACLAPTPEGLRAFLSCHQEVTAVHITSPSYEGVIADVEGIAAVCHAAGALLIVDAAWGAHQPYADELPPFPTAAGADIAITSLHKLGGGPQQTGLLLVNHDRVQRGELSSPALSVATTSPSMVLLGGIDAALREMEVNGRDHIARTIALAREFAARAGALPGADCFVAPSDCAADPTRVTVAFNDIAVTGFEVADALACRGIACEKASTSAITLLFPMGLADDAPAIAATALGDALRHGDRGRRPAPARDPFADVPSRPVMTPGIARRIGHGRCDRVPAAEAAGRIACELYEVYPPRHPRRRARIPRHRRCRRSARPRPQRSRRGDDRLRRPAVRAAARSRSPHDLRSNP